MHIVCFQIFVHNIEIAFRLSVYVFRAGILVVFFQINYETPSTPFFLFPPFLCFWIEMEAQTSSFYKVFPENLEGDRPYSSAPVV